MLQSVKYVIGEHKANIYLMIKMAFMNSEKQTVRSSLGILWTYFHDIIYVLVFMMFRLLISGSGSIMGMHGAIYIITGMIPWFFISDVLGQGSVAIRNNKGLVQSLKFPAVILPTLEVCSIFLKRMFSFVMLFVVLILMDYIKYFNFLLFVYYVICLLALMISMNFLLTAFVAISEDFRQLYMAFVKVLMYTMPIIWDYSRVSSVLINCLLRVNPMVYVIKGFRDAFVLGPTQDLLYTVYFWVSILVLFILGCFVQDKLKKYYADFV